MANADPQALGMGTRRPCVLWDMTFAVRNMSGTRLYARKLYQALAASCDWEFREIYGTRPMGGGRLGNVGVNAQSVRWLLAGAEQEVLRTHPAIYHAAAYLGPARLSCPLIVNVFDITFRNFPQFFDWKWRLYARTIIPRAIHRSAAILTLSEHARSEIVRAYGVPRAKLHVVAPGIGAEFQPGASPERIAALRAKYGLGENYLLYVGNANPRKNLPVLLAAFARAHHELPELHLVLAGAEVPSSLPVRNALTEFGIAHVVHCPGFVSEQELPILYASARAYVHTSRQEGFGIPPVEAMACGTPVISVRSPPMPEVLGDAALFSTDDSPAALAAGIVRVLTDTTCCETLRARGIERARMYTWELAARKTLDIYAGVLQESGRLNEISK